MKKQTLNIVSECHSVLGAFVKGQFLVMVLLGVVYAVGLQLIGLEDWLDHRDDCRTVQYHSVSWFCGWNYCCSHCNLFPIWNRLDGNWYWSAIVFMVGQAVEGYILQPFLLGDKIGLSPVAVVFAVLAGAQLAGFLGMLIALPVAAVIVVLLRHIREYYEHTPFYGDRAVVMQDASTGSINIETADLDVDIEMKKPQKKPLQAEEN